MNSFVLPLTCPRCGSDVEPVNIGQPVDGGTALNAIVKCTMRPGCMMEWSVHIYMMRTGSYADDGTVHGTATAFARHIKNGESPCRMCMDYRQRLAEDAPGRQLANAQ